MLQRLARQTLRQSVRNYTKPGAGNNNSAIQDYWCPWTRTLLLDRLLHNCHWFLVLQSYVRNCMEEERNVPCSIHQQGLQQHGFSKNQLGRPTFTKNRL